MSTTLAATYGRNAADRRSDMHDPTLGGARAALETLYHSFNQRSIEVFAAVWANDELISLNNPLGGIMRGAHDIQELYNRIFSGPARVWVEFHDIVEYASRDIVVFAGRERGEFARDGLVVELRIRTSRVFRYHIADGWRQVHHHGSIDDADALARYQRAVRGAA